MRRHIAYIALTAAAALFCAAASAQNMPERSLVRKGNRQFAKEHYEQSAETYRRAVEAAPDNFEAVYDLAGAMIRTEHYDKAEELLAPLAADSLRADNDRAEAYYNLGNAQFAQQKLQEALASYRRSLELNPDDMEAKYNYAYTKKLLENQQNQDQNQNNDRNQDQNQNQDQNRDQNGDGQDDRNDRNDDRNDQNDDQDNDGDGNPDDGGDGQDEGSDSDGRPKSGMNRQQQEQLLNAIQAQEDKTQDKLDEKAKKGIVVKGRKNW